MSKFLVDAFSGLVKGSFQFPLDFSTSGHYVVDAPTALQVRALSSAFADLEAAKVAAFKAAHPALASHFNDEFVLSPNVDAAHSARYAVGDDKRTILFPAGGTIVSGLLTVSSPITTVFSHWHAFTLTSEPANHPASGAPGPDRLLYLYNPSVATFEEFDPTAFTAQIRDSTNSSTLLTLTPDTEQALAFGPGDFRIRLINNDPDRAYHMSDWLILYG